MRKVLDSNEKKCLARAVKKSGFKVGDKVWSVEGSRLGGDTTGVITGFTMVTSRGQFNDFPAAIVKKSYPNSLLGRSRACLLKNLERA